MASNKNQHYVPRCHLRPFTLGSEDAAISLFNLQRKKLIANAPVKNQCSRDYFYGRDAQLEIAIQQLESAYGRAIRDVTAGARALSEENKSTFKLFWLFQHLRTEAAAMRAVEMAETTRELADLPAGEFTLGIKDAVQIACRTFANSMHEIDDLKFCIVKNRSKVPFLTSDNPAVLTNKWRLDTNRVPGRSFGIGSAGLLTLLPLTPRLLFLGYDGDVYNVPNEAGIVEIRNDRDAISLNRHQFLHCAANVYVHDAAFERVLARHYADVESARPTARHIVHYAELDLDEADHKRYIVVHPDKRDNSKEALMHSLIIHPHPGMWPSQISIRKNGAVYTNGTGIGYVRYSQSTGRSGRELWRERP